jgi:hydrogenase maturation protein HypF
MLLDEVQPAGYRSARFHASLAATLCDQAVAIRSTCGVNRIGLAGGVFQNRHLTERAFQLATAAGFEVLVPRCLPLNDAAISYGQIVEAAALHAALP